MAQFPSGTQANGKWSLKQQRRAASGYNWPLALPPVSGYIAWYTGDSFSGSTWIDLSGNGNNASVSRGTVTTLDTTGNGTSNTFKALQGSTSDGILFPASILPATYTLFHVTRHTGTASRIFTGLTNNWLSGHWSGATGVAYHEGWLTGQPNLHGSNWFISTDQNSLYRSNKVTRGSSGGSASTRLTLNAGVNSEYSSWQVAEVIVYNTTLSSNDYVLVENYLNNKYGLGL
jgi:hypothetical protein